MNGDFLRNCAINGDDYQLSEYLKGIANPCSSDEYGITPLMYAVWNGHIECVKYLVANDMGVNKKGQKISVLNEVSLRGYSALHLAALDCPPWSCKEITKLLLSMNVNKKIKCSENKTAYDIAIEHENQLFLEVYNQFENMTTELDEEIVKSRNELANKYSYRSNSTLFVKPWKANFPVPAFIHKPHRYGSIPHGMHIHEYHVEPLIESGFEKMKGKDSIHCLQFSLEEAKVNEDRRADIIHAFDPTWKPPEAPKATLFAKY